MVLETLEADLEAGKFTPESVANAMFSVELEQRLWTILVLDRILGPKFHKLFVRAKSAEDRRKVINQVYPTKLTLYGLVRNMVGAVAKENPDAAEELVAVLEGDTPPAMNRTGASSSEVETGTPGFQRHAETETPVASMAVPDATGDRYSPPHLSQTPLEDIVHEVATCAESVKDFTWIDEYGLPLPFRDGSPINDGMNEECLLGDCHEAEAKAAFLSLVYGGEVARWNLDEHCTGSYGDPNDESTFSKTGWIVKRRPMARIVVQEYGRQPAEGYEQLLEQGQGRKESSLVQSRAEVIMLSPNDIEILLRSPRPMQNMPNLDISAPLVDETERNDIRMQDSSGLSDQLKGVEQQFD